MNSIVCVHGAFHELWGPHQIAARWIPALRDGLHLAGDRRRSRRRHDRASTATCSASTPATSRPPTSSTRLAARTGILDAAARGSADPTPSPAWPRSSGRSRWTARSSSSGATSTRRRCGTPSASAIRQAIGPDTRVVVAHSLGTLATYEALVDDPTLPAVDLVTFGAVLGRPIVASGAIRPALTDGRGTWPPTVRAWTNVTAVGDMVADGFPLAPVFGAVVEQRVDNGHRAHDPEPYLCARATGRGDRRRARRPGLIRARAIRVRRAGPARAAYSTTADRVLLPSGAAQADDGDLAAARLAW